MDHVLTICFVLFLILISLSCHYFLIRTLSTLARSLLYCYEISYFFTFAFGAIWIGITNATAIGDYLNTYGFYVPSIEGLQFEYWFIVFSPFILPLMGCSIFSAILFTENSSTSSSREMTPRAGGAINAVDISPNHLAILFIGLGLCAYILVSMYLVSSSFILNYLSFLFSSSRGDEMITSRLFGFEKLGGQFFLVIYTLLPSLTFVSSFMLVKQYTLQWKITFNFLFIMSLVLSLMTYQIGMPLFFIIMSLTSFVALGKIKLTSRSLIVSLLSLFFLLHIFHLFKHDNWGVINTVFQFTFRMPSSLPYALVLYPPFVGADILGIFFNYGHVPPTNLDLAQFMYPGTTLANASSMPAHLSAYAEEGIGWATITELLVGILFVGLSRFVENEKIPAFKHAYKMQAYIAAYFLTQMSLRSALWFSYGLIWTILFLLICRFISCYKRSGSP